MLWGLDLSPLSRGWVYILRFLDYYPKSVDDIARAMDEKGTVAEIPEIFSKLIGLCINGRAKQISGNYFVKIDK